MTVLTSESTLLGTAGARLPRVNLLPPEIAEQKKARRIQAMLGVAAGAAVLLTAGLYVMASQSASSAQDELVAAQSEKSRLKTETARFASVTSTIAQKNAVEQQLVTAMGDEVRYSQILNDLSLAVPSNVWLKTLAFAPVTAGPGAAPAAGAPGAATVPGAVAASRVGTLTVTGIGFDHDDLALWLEAVAKLKKQYGNPFFSTSTKALLGTKEVVNFTSTADLLSTAQSNRYNKPAGG